MAESEKTILFQNGHQTDLPLKVLLKVNAL